MRRTLLLLAFALGLPSATRADFLITVNDLNMAEGAASATIDVTIESDNPFGDNLASFGYQFQILQSVGASQLAFGAPLTFGALGPDYVFAGVSTHSSGSALGGVSTTDYQNDTFTGLGDDTITPHDNVLVTGQKILTKLVVTPGVIAPVEGDVFHIVLVPLAGNYGTFDGSASYFADNTDAGVAFASGTGTVTITAASVPEPGTFALCGIGGLALIASRRFARKRAA